MNIEPDIFDYLETTSLEPHDDYTSEISYKDQKIIWNRLKSQQKEIERLNNIINELEKYLEEQSTNLNRLSCSGHVYFMYQEDLNILNKLKELKESGNK